jgi:RNA polymerase sigma-70 factor (ECF subfamily)
MPLPTSDAPSLVSEAASFATTHWSVVLNAQAGDAPGASEALETLCRTYYYPLYAFVRRQGHNAEAAQDLTQGFFHRFLAKDYLASVAREKGKFRSFLLASLQNFLHVSRVREGALKRGGGQTLVPLDDASVEERFLLEPALDLPPEAAYDRGWATTLMERALTRLREEFQRDGKTGQFERLKVLLSREPADGEYAALAAAMNTTTGAIGVAVHRLRQSYGQRVRAEVAHTVAQPADVEAELRYLFAVLKAG